jgi:hypothetical protein
MAEQVEITVTNLNIRQSIVVLLFKLVLIDLILAFVVIGLYYLMVQGEQLEIAASRDTLLFLSVFTILGIVKIGLTIYVVLQWLNEYYELSPDYISHKSGIVYRKTEKYKLSLVRAMDVQDSFFGEIFNFATISLFDIRMNKYLDMYLIHNAHRYARILKKLRPTIEIKKEDIRLPFLPDQGEDL